MGCGCNKERDIGAARQVKPEISQVYLDVLVKPEENLSVTKDSEPNTNKDGQVVFVYPPVPFL
jgi:hypothetical protein